MKQLTAFLLLAIVCLLLSAAMPLGASTSPTAGDSTLPVLSKTHFVFKSPLVPVAALAKSNRPVKGVLGFTQQSRPVEMYYFPGTSEKRALVIGGVHGSELSAIAVANQLIKELNNGAPTYYSVVVIPCLFPDNAAQAEQHADEIGSTKNIGRYTQPHLPDPNRQMPPLGRAFDQRLPLDFVAREIEPENQLLLQLIQDYQPERIVNLHAIRNTAHAGVFADPRTDCLGMALGYETDSLLALTMAEYIHQRGGHVKGNALDGKRPTTLYLTDPPIAPKGKLQKRALTGSSLPGNRGTGVSLGAWASTAVCDTEKGIAREAIRVITIEFPGNRRPADYTPAEQKEYAKQVALYTEAVAQVFLGNYFTEEAAAPPVAKN